MINNLSFVVTLWSLHQMKMTAAQHGVLCFAVVVVVVVVVVAVE